MLLPNLDGPSAIVMDNASFYSMQSDKCPTSNTRKADIQVLTKEKILFQTYTCAYVSYLTFIVFKFASI